MITIDIEKDLQTLRDIRSRWLNEKESTPHEGSALSALGAVCDNLQGELNRRKAAAPAPQASEQAAAAASPA